jgi:hypothetical protein
MKNFKLGDFVLAKFRHHRGESWSVCKFISYSEKENRIEVQLATGEIWFIPQDNVISSIEDAYNLDLKHWNEYADDILKGDRDYFRKGV